MVAGSSKQSPMASRSESARSALDLKALVRGIGAGERAVVARAITLIESKRGDHQKAARELVQDLLPNTGKAVRVGITGMPGVGKSTTIDALGTYLTEQGHRVAVLAVDPSSNRTGGSILADKTRLPRLAADPAALTGDGIAELWRRVLEHREKLTQSCELAQRRREQQVKWMWTMLDDRLFTRLKSDPALRARLPALEAAVAEGRLSPALAVDEIAQAMGL